MKNIYWIILLSFCHCSIFTIKNNSAQKFDSTKIRAKILKLAQDIAKDNSYMGDSGGISGDTPEQYIRFLDLKENATKEELIELANFPNSVVKAYVYISLLYRREISNPYKTIRENLHDTEYFTSCPGGCVCSYTNLANVLYFSLKDRISKQEKKEIIKAVFELNSNSDILFLDIYNEGTIDQEFYPYIRNAFKKNKDLDAMLALTKFRKEEDLDLILDFNPKKENLYQKFLALSRFPSKKTLNYLVNYSKELEEENANDQFWEMYYLALLENDLEKEHVEIWKKPFQILHSSKRLRHFELMSYYLLNINDRRDKPYISNFQEVYFLLNEHVIFKNKEVIKNICNLDFNRCIHGAFSGALEKKYGSPFYDLKTYFLPTIFQNNLKEIELLLGKTENSEMIDTLLKVKIHFEDSKFNRFQRGNYYKNFLELSYRRLGTETNHKIIDLFYNFIKNHDLDTQGMKKKLYLAAKTNDYISKKNELFFK